MAGVAEVGGAARCATSLGLDGRAARGLETPHQPVVTLAGQHRADARYRQGPHALHAPPAAFHNLDTEVGRHSYTRYGLTALEVTDEVFESGASIVFTQAARRLHTIDAVLVAILA